MKPTRTSTLAVVAVVCALAAWLLLKLVYASLPPLPWTGVPALLVAALAEAWMGLDVRARIAGRRFAYAPEAVVWHAGNASWQAGFERPGAENARLVARNGET